MKLMTKEIEQKLPPLYHLSSPASRLSRWSSSSTRREAGPGTQPKPKTGRRRLAVLGRRGRF